MKAICTIDNLKKGILTAEKIIGRNLTLPILSNILMEAEKGGIKISATNLEIGVVAKIRAKIEESGKTAIPGKIAGGILSQIGDENQITIEEKNNILKMIYNGNSASIKGMDAGEFPIIPKPESRHLFEIEAADFQKKINNILIATAVSDTRQELTGVYLEFLKNGVIFAATDSFRLTELGIGIKKEKITEDYNKYIAKNRSVIIPSRTLVEVSRSMPLNNGSIKVYLSENQIFLEMEDILFVSRLIDGKYPEYKQVIPKDFLLNISLKKESLLKAARLAGVFSDSKSREVRIKIDGKKGKVIVSAQSIESGEGSWGVSCLADKENEIEVAFNNRYLLDGINSIETEDVFVSLNDSFGPVMFREMEKGKPKNGYFHIIMPIRS